MRTSREVKRWDAVTRSPVFAAFSASLKGLPTIRAFAAQRRFQADFLCSLAHNGDWNYAFLATGRCGSLYGSDLDEGYQRPAAHLDANFLPSLSCSARRWIAVRLDLLSATTLLSTALLAMAMRKHVSPAVLALALTYTMQLTGLMQW